MGEYIKYTCNTCGHDYIHNLDIFWFDENMEINVAPLLMSTSNEMSKALVSGFYYEYCCYDCDKIVEEFIVHENSSKINHEEIITLIEEYDNNSKIIKFDDGFQKCLNCGKDLKLKSKKYFTFDEDTNFVVEDILREDVINNDKYEFWGIYYGFYCEDCSKQINKFVIKQNLANLTESLIESILEDHTNDLTVLLFDNKKCPSCGGDIHSIEHGSLCPKCMKGKMIIKDRIDVD